MKKKLLTTSLGILFSICLIAGCGANSSEQAITDAGSTAAEGVTEKETEEVTETVTEAVTEEATETEVYDPEIIAGLSTEQSDEDSLINLVKNTVISVKSQMDYNLKEANASTVILSKALDSFTQTKTDAIDPNSIFDYGEEGNPYAETIPEMNTWTYNDVAGSIGYFVFYITDDTKSISYMFTQKGEFLKEFFINDFYHADENSFSDFELSGVTDEKFSPSKDTMDINYKLQFKYNGQTYTALIGNMNQAYKVLDIVKGAKITSSANNSNKSNKSSSNNRNNTTNESTTTDTSNNNPVPDSVAPVVDGSTNDTNTDNTNNEVPVPETNSSNSDLGGTWETPDDPSVDPYSPGGTSVLPEYDPSDINQNCY